MTFAIDRRLLLKSAMLGLGALSVPAWAELAAARGFTHNVASGEPGADRVMLWTRYVPPAGRSGRLRWQVAATPELAAILAEGDVTAHEERDWCVKPVAGGLAPGRWYYYRFIDDGDATSPVGRTGTLPVGPVADFTIALFSCSNLPYGYFNAYAHAAARQDIDLLLHVGDYFYEYKRGKYPEADARLSDRLLEPGHETVALADYRARFACYRRDPDLQRLHQLFPMVMMWDDHESANDSWKGGAENHQPGTEGDWQVRKTASMRAYREWLPVSDALRNSYRIGDLAHLFRPETRLTARSEQLDLKTFLTGREDIPAALNAFRDGPWRDETRTIMGFEQESWLADAMERSAAEDVKWQILGQQVVMGSVSLSPEIVDLMSADAEVEARQVAQIGLLASEAGLPYNFDSWDGYPAARSRLLASAQEADADLIVLSGDSHNAWAFELDERGEPAGVEFAVQSVTSPGYEKYLAGDPAAVARAIVSQNHQLHWADTSRRGYLTVTLTPERAVSEWNFMQTVTQRSTALSGQKRMSVTRGGRRFDPA